MTNPFANGYGKNCMDCGAQLHDLPDGTHEDEWHRGRCGICAGKMMQNYVSPRTGAQIMNMAIPEKTSTPIQGTPSNPHIHDQTVKCFWKTCQACIHRDNWQAGYDASREETNFAIRALHDAGGSIYNERQFSIAKLAMASQTILDWFDNDCSDKIVMRNSVDNLRDALENFKKFPAWEKER